MNRRTTQILRVERLEARDAPTVVPVGGEFRVNTTTTSSQYPGGVAVDTDGDFVVVWESSQNGTDYYYDVYAQRYNGQGVPQGAEFRVNTYTIDRQSFPDVAADADGDFVVAWTSDGQDGSDRGVYAQRYSAAGVPLGGEFRVNTHTTGTQQTQAVAMDAAGNFVVAWNSYLQDGSGDGIYAQRYSAAGVPLGGEFRVNTHTTGQQSTPAVAVNAAGDFVIAWESGAFGPFQDGSGIGVYAQRYSAAGAPLGGEFRINTFTTGDQRSPAVAADGDGDFVIAWSSGVFGGPGQDGSSLGVYAQRYSAAGLPLGIEFRVNSYTTNHQRSPRVAVDAAGDFVVTWYSQGQDGSGYGVYAQAYRANGAPDGTEFRANTYTTMGQAFPYVAVDAAGDFVVVWQSYNQDGSVWGIYAQRYRLELPPRVAGTAVNGGAAQRSRVTDLAVTFSAQVTFASTPGAAFTLARDSDGAAVTFTATADVVAGVTVVTLTNFSGAPTGFGSLADGRYTLTALANQITAGGVQLDGNGDGTAGDDQTFGDAQGLFRYYGDMNADRRVDISDFGFFSLAYLTQANYNTALDFNNDGRVDIADFGQFSVRYFTTLP